MRVQWIVLGLLMVLALLFVWFTEWTASDEGSLEGLQAIDLAPRDADVLAAEEEGGEEEEDSADETQAAEEEARAAASRREAALASKSGRAAAREVRVRGRVLDLEEEPVPDARVLFARRSARTEEPIDSLAFLEVGEVQWVETNEEGAFELLLRAPGAIRLGIRHDGHAPLDHDGLFVPDERTHDLGDFTLLPGLLLRGVVRDPEGEPAQGVRLELTAPEAPTFAGETDEKGEFVVATVAPGAWRLEFKTERYPWAVASGVDDEPGTEIDLEVQLEAGCSRAVVVRGLEGFDPPPRIRATPVRGGSEYREIEADPREAVGPPDRGAYTFSVGALLPDVEYAFQLREASGDERWLTYAKRATCGGLSEEFSGATEVLSFDLHERGSLRFEVLDDVTERPIQEFQVAVVTQAQPAMDTGEARPEPSVQRYRYKEGPSYHRIEASTDEGLTRDGRKWVLGSVPNTLLHPEIELEFRAEGYRVHRWKPSRIAPRIANDVGVVRMTPMARLDVLVLDGDDRPVSDAVVYAELHTNYVPPPMLDAFVPDYPPRLTARTTNRQGRVRLPAARASSFTVWAEHPSYAIPWPADAFSHLDETIELRLTPGGTVAIRVRNQAKIPMQGWEVSHRELLPPMHPRLGHPRSGSLVTDADGVCVFEHLTEGNHVFEVHYPDGQVTATETVVTAYEGTILEFDLVVPEVFDLTGVVTTEDVVLPGAEVTVHQLLLDEAAIAARIDAEAFGLSHSAFTDGLGRYRFWGLPVGAYAIDVGHPDRALASRFELGVELEGAYVRDFDLPASRILGRVVDAEGPLAGVWVAVHPEPRARALRAHDVDRGYSADYHRSHQTTTDELGYFELAGLPLDLPLVVEARAAGYAAAWSEPIRLGELVPEHTSLQLRLEPACSLLVSVRDGEQPVASHPVSLRGPRGVRRSATTDARGRCYFGPLLPGRWAVSLRARETTVVELEPGDTEFVDFEF